MSAKWKNPGAFLTEENLKLILNALDEGIHIVDEDGRTVFYNKKVSEIDGLEQDEVLGENIFQAYPSLTFETSTLLQTLKKGEPIDNIQQSFINNKGKKITTINKTVPIKFSDGRIGAMEISRDITQLENLVDNINHLRGKMVNNSKKSRKEPGAFFRFKDIIGEDKRFCESLKDAMRAAGSKSSVLLAGETGTGKELFAQGIHNAGSRSQNPFIAQNCAALPKDLLEGILFGTEKGGFTGAKKRPGLFEQADGGTILLDEINSMDLALQAKLLRVLQDNKIRRIGGQKEIDVDVRIIATMNTHPDRALKENLLREDLFYRLSVVYIEIPPLRERKGDISLLTDYFIKIYNKNFSKSIKGIDSELNRIFKVYDWPGNVRELQHVIESAFNMLQNEELIKFRNLPSYIKDRLGKADRSNNIVDLNLSGEELPSLDEVLERIEFDLLKRALQMTGGNISAAARKLSISRQSLQYKMRKFGIKNA